MIRALLLLLAILPLTASDGRAQSSKSKKANKLYYRAQLYKSRRQDDRAELTMEKALKADPAFTEAAATLGAWLMNRQQYSRAVPVYERLAAGGRGKPAFVKQWLRSLIYTGMAERALEVMPQTADSQWAPLRRQAQLLLRLRAAADTTQAYVIGPVERVNTDYAELFPVLSADGNTLYYTRRVAGMDEDFFYAHPDSCGGWLTGRNMGSPPNTKQQEAAQMISADGHYLFYMRCDNRSETGWDRGGCDLYMAYTADSVWSVAESFGGVINTPAYEGMPCLSADNRELFFVSDRPGGYGGLDLWVSRFDQGVWQEPQNLGPRINTPGNETAPFLHADGQSLYFASDGLPGIGGSDIFTASRQLADTVWSAPANLGMPFNTPYDEASLSITPDGMTALFASNRERLAGNYDLFTAAVPARFRPHPVSYVTGRTYDSLTGAPLTYGRVYLSDSSGRDLYQVVTNAGDGSFMLALPSGHRYGCFVTRIGYSELTDTLFCEQPTLNSALVKNFAMLPLGYEKPTTDTIVARLPFRKNAVVLSDSLSQLLSAGLEGWRGRPGRLTIMVNGYTDDSGTPLINEQLSAARARVVADRIRSLGFPADSVQQQGWGQANAIVPNDTEENRDINRRVEVVIRW